MEKLRIQSSKIFQHAQVLKLIQVYQDLERTLRKLKKREAESKKGAGPIQPINMYKLISQLSRSKKKLERKIGNTLLLEKQQLKRKIKNMTQDLVQRAG